MFVETRDQSREYFLRVWHKMNSGEALQPLEAVIARVIGDHPEYHGSLNAPHGVLERDFDGADGRTNPFLHMGLHIAIVEQLQTDRPGGIRQAYQQLLSASGDDSHAVEHRMMECLARSLWQAGAEGGAPDERSYLADIQRLLG